MKQPILLKRILDIIFIIVILSLLTPLIIYPISLSFENPIPIEINNHVIQNFTLLTSSLILVNFIISGFSVYIIFLIRKLVKSFLKNYIFTSQQIFLFRLIGRLIIICGLAKMAVNFLSTFAFQSETRIGLGSEVSFNLLFIIAIGLFFIYLSQVFHKAKSLKEETELTI